MVCKVVCLRRTCYQVKYCFVYCLHQRQLIPVCMFVLFGGSARNLLLLKLRQAEYKISVVFLFHNECVW